VFAIPESGPAILVLPDEAATVALARRLAAGVRQGDVIALSGPLGAGKTAFARAFIRSFIGETEEVPSPTFGLVQTYDTDRGTLWHFDLYRISDPQETRELGFDEALAGLAVLIEWPERLGTDLPGGRVDIRFSQGNTPDARVVRLSAAGGNSLLSRAGLGVYF
jgi:tRNA threonylcarbamoyladenosine biosynthesis protein TsaE